ncbi:tetratricopeptide repeat protein [Kitasatospora sp. NPDC049258]|uniref:tetratricopeptide repeat protein n=1 Tax=Kitasatospora sp. NPDC049258 TaxID=3155394 RepID=UPI0034420858
MHWFSEHTTQGEAWAEVLHRSVTSARALGSKRDEAVHLNYLAWADNLCVLDPTAGLATAHEALDAAHQSDDRSQVGWALGYMAGALNRLGRIDESITRLQEAAEHLRKQTGPTSRLAEITTLDTLGKQLCQTGRADEALATVLRHLDRRDEAHEVLTRRPSRARRTEQPSSRRSRCRTPTARRIHACLIRTSSPGRTSFEESQRNPHEQPVSPGCRGRAESTGECDRLPSPGHSKELEPADGPLPVAHGPVRLSPHATGQPSGCTAAVSSVR